MNEPGIGDPFPAFELPVTGGGQLRRDDLLGALTVIYCYPRDDTPGCTSEGQDFRDQYPAFTAVDARIYGLSRDGLASHEKFKAKYEFPFELIADPDEQLCQALGVIREKNMYGKKVMGIERSTFLLDREGVIRQVWRKVKVPDHVDQVLAAVRELAD